MLFRPLRSPFKENLQIMAVHWLLFELRKICDFPLLTMIFCIFVCIFKISPFVSIFKQSNSEGTVSIGKPNFTTKIFPFLRGGSWGDYYFFENSESIPTFYLCILWMELNEMKHGFLSWTQNKGVKRVFRTLYFCKYLHKEPKEEGKM